MEDEFENVEISVRKQTSKIDEIKGKKVDDKMYDWFASEKCCS